MTRPPYPSEGWELGWEAVPDPHWTYSPDDPRRCRFGSTTSYPSQRCPNRATALLARPVGGRRTRPWAYCADHLYGRWIEDGKVMDWREVRP